MYASIESVSKIVAAYVSCNRVTVDEVPEVISIVHAALTQKGAEEPAPAEPAVPVKKSVLADHIVCLEDGKKVQMLKRHLLAAHNLTPQQYRAKWGLSKEYPMTAPNYSAWRSELAKSIGLGKVEK